MATEVQVGPEERTLRPGEHRNLAAALAAFQSELPTIKKGNTADVNSAKGSYSYQYADLADISPLVMPLLGKNGLAFTSRPTLVGSDFVLHYMLTHESGETLEGEYPLPDPTIPAQQLGAAITYARRYALCSVTGVAPGGDDDDAASNPSAPARKTSSRKAPAAKPTAPSFAKTNWAAEIADADDVEQLRTVHTKVTEAGEMGLLLDPKFQTHLDGLVELWGLAKPNGPVPVGGAIAAVRAAMEAKAAGGSLPGEDENGPAGAPDADEPETTTWETATPGGDPA